MSNYISSYRGKNNVIRLKDIFFISEYEVWKEMRVFRDIEVRLNEVLLYLNVEIDKVKKKNYMH